MLAARAQAGLHTGGAVVGAFVGAEKHVFELHHAAVGEHERGVVGGHERAGGDNLMPFGFKKFKEFFADFSAFH